MPPAGVKTCGEAFKWVVNYFLIFLIKLSYWLLKLLLFTSEGMNSKSATTPVREMKGNFPSARFPWM